MKSRIAKIEGNIIYVDFTSKSIYLTQEEIDKKVARIDELQSVLDQWIEGPEEVYRALSDELAGHFEVLDNMEEQPIKEGRVIFIDFKEKKRVA